jgi:hypothetical protein
MKTLKETMEDLFEMEIDYWEKIVKQNPDHAITQLALMSFEESIKNLNEDEIRYLWRRIKNGNK